MATPTAEDWTSTDTTALFGAILTLESVADAEAFFRDLCTRRELEELTQRWAVVRMLAEGLAYRDIAQRSHCSTATVTRINEWLQHGTGGYRQALERLGLATERPS